MDLEGKRLQQSFVKSKYSFDLKCQKINVHKFYLRELDLKISLADLTVKELVSWSVGWSVNQSVIQAVSQLVISQ